MQEHDRLTAPAEQVLDDLLWDRLPDAPHPDEFVPSDSGVFRRVVVHEGTVMSDGVCVLGPCGFYTVVAAP